MEAANREPFCVRYERTFCMPFSPCIIWASRTGDDDWALAFWDEMPAPPIAIATSKEVQTNFMTTLPVTMQFKFALSFGRPP